MRLSALCWGEGRWGNRSEEGGGHAQRRVRAVGKVHDQVPEHLARWSDQLSFHYESTGEEGYFCDRRDPKPRSRRVFAFHKPETLHAWLKEEDTLRGRLQHMPPLDTSGLRDCQVEAVNGLDASLAQDQPRALIQMATGAGKTFTACTFSWRLLKFAKAHRILFLVDRNNLGDQTLKEYQNYDPPGSGRKFDKTYIVQHLHSNRIDPMPRWSSPRSSGSMPCCEARSWMSQRKRPLPSRRGAMKRASFGRLSLQPSLPD
jgi:type I site-specific restriction endonuclease